MNWRCPECGNKGWTVGAYGLVRDCTSCQAGTAATGARIPTHSFDPEDPEDPDHTDADGLFDPEEEE